MPIQVAAQPQHQWMSMNRQFGCMDTHRHGIAVGEDHGAFIRRGIIRAGLVLDRKELGNFVTQNLPAPAAEHLFRAAVGINDLSRFGIGQKRGIG